MKYKMEATTESLRATAIISRMSASKVKKYINYDVFGEDNIKKEAI